MAETTKKTARKPKSESAKTEPVPVTFCNGDRVEMLVDGGQMASVFASLTGRELPADVRVRLLPQSTGQVLVELVFRTAARAEEFANG